MVIYCVAYGCKNLQQKGNDIQFYRFPHKRPEILQKWVDAIKRDKWNPLPTSRICIEHFQDCVYYLSPGASKKLLKHNAVPSIFNFPQHLVKVEKARRVLVRHKEQSDGALKKMEAEATTSTAEPVVTVTDKAVQIGKMHSLKKQKLLRRVQTLQQKIQRRDERMKTMTDLIRSLQKNRVA